MSKYGGLKKVRKFGFIERQQDRGDASAIYLLKSLNGLNRKERIYALGYNISSISAVTGFDFGLLAGAPYFIGETLNNLRAFKGASQGDFSKLKGRTGFLGSANLMNKYASKAFNAVTSPTGVGAVDRYVNIYVGQERAKFLQYIGSKSRGEQMKVFVESLGRVFDTEMKKQVSGGSAKGNVFAKWTNMTYYNAVKNAPNPWKENPYVQARKTGSRRLKKSNRRYNTSAQSAIAAYSGGLESDDFLRDMMAQSDEYLNDIVSNQALIKASALDSELRKAGVAQPNMVNASTVGQINKLYKDSERAANIKTLNRLDNMTYKQANLETSPVFGEDYLKLSGPRGLDSNQLEKMYGLKTDPASGMMTTTKGRSAQQKKLTQMNTNAARDIGAEIPKGHGKAAALAKIADTIPMNAATVKAFNVFAAEMGVNFPMQAKGATRGSFNSAVLSVLYSNIPDRQQFALDLGQTLGAVGRLANTLDQEGLGKYAKEIVKLVDPKMKAINTNNKTKTLMFNPAFDLGGFNVSKGTHFMDIRQEHYNIMEQFTAYGAHRKHVKGSMRAINLVNKSRRTPSGGGVGLSVLGFDELSDQADALDAYYENIRLQKEQLRKTPVMSKNKFINSKLGTRNDRANLVVNFITDSQDINSYVPVDWTKHSMTSKHFQVRKNTVNHLKHIFGVDAANEIADEIFSVTGQNLGNPGAKPVGEMRYNPKKKKYERGDPGIVAREQYALNKKLGARRRKNYEKMIKFIKGGAAPSQILEMLEAEYDGTFNQISKALNKKGTAVAAKGILSEADLMSNFTPGYMDMYVPDQLKNKKGEKYNARQGQSTMIHTHHNYVPTKSHIIDAIHMHPVEYDGKDEQDGSPYLFQFQVSFGGKSHKSQYADRIRDAFQLEFGGLATDKFGGTRHRHDRMAYLPSFFLGTAATVSAASLGIFDKGVPFKGAVPKGAQSQLGKSADYVMSDDAVGPFNNLRRKFQEDKKELYEGRRRTKKMFKDMKSTINNPRQQYKNFDTIATRMAAYRAMSLFKKGGGFGEVRMGDITKRLSDTEAKLFGIDTSGPYDLGAHSKIDTASLGYLTPQAVKLDFTGLGQIRQTFHQGNTNYKRATRSFRVEINHNSLTGNFVQGYMPVIKTLNEMYNYRIGARKKFVKGKAIEEQIRTRSKYEGTMTFKGFKQLQGEAVFVNAALNGFFSGSKAFDGDALAKFYENPYDFLEETFQLGKPTNGAKTVWGQDNILNNAHHPDNPAVKLMELIGTNRNFEAEMIRQMMNGAEAAFMPVIAPMLGKGKAGASNIMSTLRNEAAKVAYQTRRALNSAIMYGAGSDYFTDEMYFRSLTFQMAELVEASKVHFQTNIKERLARAMGESRLTPTVKENLLKKLDKGEIKGFDSDTFHSGAFSAQADVLASGGVIAYADDGSPFMLNLVSGQMEENVNDYLRRTVGYKDEEIMAFGDSVSPNYTKINRKTQHNIYNTEGRKAALLRHMGVDDYEEIQWNRSLRFGMTDVNPGTKAIYGDTWATARELEAKLGKDVADAAKMLSNPEELVAAIAKADPQLYDTIVNVGDVGARTLAEQNLLEMKLLDAYKDKIGTKSKHNLSPRIDNFGKIVADKKYKSHTPNDRTFEDTMARDALRGDVRKQVTSDLRLFTNSFGSSGQRAGNAIANRIYYPLQSGQMEPKDVGAILRYAVDGAKSTESAADFIEAFIVNVARKGTYKQSMGFAEDQSLLYASLTFMGTPELTMVRMPHGIRPSELSRQHIVMMVKALRSENFNRFSNINQLEKLLGSPMMSHTKRTRKVSLKGPQALSVVDPGSDITEIRYIDKKGRKLSFTFNQKKYDAYLAKQKKKRGRKK
tara:strand:+ start:2191 stop:7725 length:5535 start_codon:yes stop_codon:yes gene_type:complete